MTANNALERPSAHRGRAVVAMNGVLGRPLHLASSLAFLGTSQDKLRISPKDRKLSLSSRSNVLSNNACERPSGHRGRAVLAMDCVLGGAERAPCLAAQLGR